MVPAGTNTFLGLQTAFPAETRSVGTHTSIFTTNMGTLQQWRSIQGALRVELHRLQHRVNFINAQVGDKKVCPPVLSKVCRTESNPSRFTLDRSCSAETAVGHAPPGSPEKAARKKHLPFQLTLSHHATRQRTGHASAERQKKVAMLSPQATKDF